MKNDIVIALIGLVIIFTVIISTFILTEQIEKKSRNAKLLRLIKNRIVINLFILIISMSLIISFMWLVGYFKTS